MNYDDEAELLALAKKENWKIVKAEDANLSQGRDDSPYAVIVRGQVFPLCHPYDIHITLYRRCTDADERYFHMKRAHDYLWPEFAETWNHWDERRFRAHCADYEQIVLAGGASVAKSHCVGRIACLFYLSNPKKNAVLIASTTLESLEGRIWGYVVKFLDTAALPLPVKILEGKPPKVLPLGVKGKTHGMFAVAIKQTDDDTTIANLIGRHPDKRFLVCLDEATEMSPAITKAFPNWKKGVDHCQIWAIGNSNAKNDLHGALATPRVGWGNIDPMRDLVWPTMHDNGICIYFNPYDSPAIIESDPAKRALLSRFLPTLRSIKEDEARYGRESSAFYRFTMGFWQKQSIENTVLTEAFVTEYDISRSAEWSGFAPLHVVAGLDPAFARGGTGCVLRLGILGHTVTGQVVLDYRDTELLFPIDVRAGNERSGELQLVAGVLEVLVLYQCALQNVAIDATGGGRALGELLRIVSLQPEYRARVVGSGNDLIKIVSVGKSSGLNRSHKDPSIIIATPSDLWFQFKNFLSNKQIKGLDKATVFQFVNRMTKTDKHGKLVLETKDEYKARMNAIDPKMAHSPDEADASVLTLHSAILRYGFHQGQRHEVRAMDPRAMEKMLVYEAMRRERLGLGPGGFDERKRETARAAIVPNFSGALEDVPKPRG